MHRHLLITSALLLGFTAPAAAQTQPQQPPQAVVQGQGTVEVRPAEPQIRIESAPPQVQVETPGEPEIKVVQVPTIDGRMPEDVVGQTVKNSEGEDIGEVRDFITQPDSAAIDSLVLSRAVFLASVKSSSPSPGTRCGSIRRAMNLWPHSPRTNSITRRSSSTAAKPGPSSDRNSRKNDRPAA